VRDYISQLEAELERAEREGIRAQMPRLAGE
jgi:hypothetical protein